MTVGAGNVTKLSIDAIGTVDGLDAIDAVGAMDTVSAADPTDTTGAADGVGMMSGDGDRHEVSFTGDAVVHSGGSGWDARPIKGFCYHMDCTVSPFRCPEKILLLT